MPGIYEDGFATILSCSLKPNIKLYETEVTPPSMDTGETIPQDHMRSVTYITKAFQKLIEITDGTATFAFEAAAVNDLRAIIGKNQQITITLPDGFKIIFWGGFKNATFSSFAKGTRPTMTTVIVVTNKDLNGVESGPTWGY